MEYLHEGVYDIPPPYRQSIDKVREFCLLFPHGDSSFKGGKYGLLLKMISYLLTLLEPLNLVKVGVEMC